MKIKGPVITRTGRNHVGSDENDDSCGGKFNMVGLATCWTCRH